MPADTTEIWVNDGTGNNFKPPSYPQNGAKVKAGSSVSFKAQASAGGDVKFYAYTGSGETAIPAFTDSAWPYTAPARGGQSNSYTLLSTIEYEAVTLSLTAPHNPGPIVGTNGTINVGGGSPE